MRLAGGTAGQAAASRTSPVAASAELPQIVSRDVFSHPVLFERIKKAVSPSVNADGRAKGIQPLPVAGSILAAGPSSALNDIGNDVPIADGRSLKSSKTSEKTGKSQQEERKPVKFALKAILGVNKRMAVIAVDNQPVQAFSVGDTAGAYQVREIRADRAHLVSAHGQFWLVVGAEATR